MYNHNPYQFPDQNLARQDSTASKDSKGSEDSRGTDSTRFGGGSAGAWYDGSENVMASYTDNELAENHRQYVAPRPVMMSSAEQRQQHPREARERAMGFDRGMGQQQISSSVPSQAQSSGYGYHSVPKQPETLGYGYHAMQQQQIPQVVAGPGPRMMPFAQQHQQQLPQIVAGPNHRMMPSAQPHQQQPPHVVAGPNHRMMPSAQPHQQQPHHIVAGLSHGTMPVAQGYQYAQSPPMNPAPSSGAPAVLGQNRPGGTVQHFVLDDLATAYKKHGPGSMNPNNVPSGYTTAADPEAPKESLLFAPRKMSTGRKVSLPQKKPEPRMASEPRQIPESNKMIAPRKWSEPTKPQTQPESKHTLDVDFDANKSAGGEGYWDGRHTEALLQLTGGRPMGDEARLPKSKPTANFTNFKETLLGRVAEQTKSHLDKQEHVGLASGSGGGETPTDAPTVAELVEHINRSRNNTLDSTADPEHRSIGDKVLNILKLKPKHSSDPTNPATMVRSHRVSLSPARQAHFYAKFELTVSTAISNFLLQHEDLLDEANLNREIRAWEGGSWSMFEGPSQKRYRPSGFMFPLDVQHRLLQKNCEAFLKHGAFSDRNVLLVRQAAKIIAGWGRVVDGLPHKTLCEPDWLLIERLQGAEKLIQLLGNHFLSSEVANYTAWKLQMVMEIMDAADLIQKQTDEEQQSAAAL